MRESTSRKISGLWQNVAEREEHFWNTSTEIKSILRWGSAKYCKGLSSQSGHMQSSLHNKQRIYQWPPSLLLNHIILQISIICPPHKLPWHQHRSLQPAFWDILQLEAQQGSRFKVLDQKYSFPNWEIFHRLPQSLGACEAREGRGNTTTEAHRSQHNQPWGWGIPPHTYTHMYI